MAKYDDYFKLRVVMDYLSGKGGMKFIARKFGIPSSTTVKKWVNAYQFIGKEGLKRRFKHSHYSVQFKRDVIEYMVRTGESAQSTANKFGINEPPLVLKWKKQMELGGMAALNQGGIRYCLINQKSRRKKRN